MTDLAKKTVDIAITQIGQDEKPHGSNWGHPVQNYLSVVGIGFPASWCMAFVQWCLLQAAREIGGATIPLKKSGGVLDVWNHIKPEQRVKIPQPGDIFIQDHGKGLGHTGIIESVNGLEMHTIEGNTNDTGSREGFEVCRKKRLIASAKGFIRV